MLILKSVNFEQQQFQHHQLEQSYPGQKEWLIGRNSTCDLVLSSPEVSRIHGRIIRSDDAYYFVDNDSTSGSLLNGKMVAAQDRHRLRPGDLLQLGETFLHVEEVMALSTDSESSYLVTSPSFPQPEMLWNHEDLLCRCCRIVNETPDVKTFYFIAEPPVLFHYLPGQFVNLEVNIDGKPVIRSYSISSSPTRPYHLSLTIKRVASPAAQPDVPPGLVSNWLHDHFQVGDRLKLVGGPAGHFTCLPHLPPKLLLISAGSGITPMMSMTRWVQDTLLDCDVVFLHSARTVDDIVFRSELEAIATQMPNFHLAVTLTQQSPGRSWMGLTGRISESILQLVAPDLHERAVYVCGPEGFMENVRSLLESLQFPMQNYQEESFGYKRSKPGSGKLSSSAIAPPRSARSASPDGNGRSLDSSGSARSIPVNAEPLIRFVKSGQAVVVNDNASILEIAEQEGIAIRNACRMGACGACKVRVCQGQVRYDTPPPALTTTDQEAGYALACVAYPVDELEIDA